MSNCIHPAEHVTADILEGDCLPEQVQWCRLCGAYRRVALNTATPWRVPEPLSRAQFLKLPMETRRLILAAQAEPLIEHYNALEMEGK